MTRERVAANELPCTRRLTLSAWLDAPDSI